MDDYNMKQSSTPTNSKMVAFMKLCWFQTSFPLAALPLCCVITAWRFMVTVLSGHTALASHQAASLPSWIEVNCMRSAAVGKAARLSIYWQDAACRLVILLRQVVLAQLYKYHHQSCKASLKAALRSTLNDNLIIVCTISSWHWCQCELVVIERTCRYISFACHVYICSVELGLCVFS